MLTKNGIQLDIEKSEYTFLIDNLNFYFSSEFYKNKFINELSIYTSSECIKLKNKFRVNFSESLFFAICLYKRIEKRGYFIKNLTTGQALSENPTFKITLI